MSQTFNAEVQVDKAIKRLTKAAKKIKKTNEKVVKDVTRLSWEYARNLAPFYTGELVSMITFEQESPECWLLISRAKHSSNLSPPLNVRFDEGNFSGMTMGKGEPFIPRRDSSIGFMKKTIDFAKEEFENRLNIEIGRLEL